VSTDNPTRTEAAGRVAQLITEMERVRLNVGRERSFWLVNREPGNTGLRADMVVTLADTMYLMVKAQRQLHVIEGWLTTEEDE
jgi:hypothetical protein